MTENPNEQILPYEDGVHQRLVSSPILEHLDNTSIPRYLLTLKRHNQRIPISRTYSTPTCFVGPYVTRQTMIERS